MDRTTATFLHPHANLRLTCLLAFALLSCSPSGPFTDAEGAAVTEEVRAMLGSYYSDVAAEGLRAEFRYLEDSDDFFWVPPGYTSALTYDSVHAILVGNADMWRTVGFSWDTLSIVPYSPELAAYTGIVRSEMVDTAGTLYRSRLLETGIVRKGIDGRWRLAGGQSRMMQEP